MWTKFKLRSPDAADLVRLSSSSLMVKYSASQFRAELRHTPDLEQAAGNFGWESAVDRSVSVTRAINLRLPAGAHLWQRGQRFV